MPIVITGIDGFIGRNLKVKLRELGYTDIVGITRASTDQDLIDALSGASFVFHLAGVNRPKDASEFAVGNRDFSERICAVLTAAGLSVPIVFASSTQATLDNPYGLSKRAAEEAFLRYAESSGAPVHIFRLTNVFGKWARPGYNSVVATFCHNIARGLPISVNNPAATLRLIYIDDVIAAFTALLEGGKASAGFVEAGPVYETTVGELAEILHDFAASRTTLTIPSVGTGLIRALYATYVSHLPQSSFAYAAARDGDDGCVSVEMLKTPDCGQFSYFTAQPGTTRGEHYHHTTTEKFLVISGTARFGFRQIETGETCEIVVRGDEARIVEAIPGWAHNVTNIGDRELVIMLWANEIFDRDHPDTTPMKVSP